jgi:hypothetical protein
MRINRISTVFLLGILLTGSIHGDDSDPLVKRIKAHDLGAIYEAGNQGRQDLIPLLEEIYDGKHGDSPASASAQCALAKLGNEKHLAAILQEVLNPSIAPRYQEEKHDALINGASDKNADAWATWKIQECASRKLAYLQDERTVQYIAPLLYDIRLVDIGHLTDSPLNGASAFAVVALSRIIKKDSPVFPRRSCSEEETAVIWQKWWETHKDYYTKLKPILPVSAVGTNQVTQPKSSGLYR